MSSFERYMRERERERARRRRDPDARPRRTPRSERPADERASRPAGRVRTPSEGTRRLLGRRPMLFAVLAIVAATVLVSVAWARHGSPATGPARPPTTVSVPATRLAGAVAASRTPEPEPKPKLEASKPALKPSAPVKAKELPKPPPKVEAFDGGYAMRHVVKFADDIGVRKGGTDGELAAATYARDYLKSIGYAAEIVDVPLPNGRMSRNVVARKKGATPWTIVLGGHMDTKSPAPGGNDNASGCAVVLELARMWKDREMAANVTFVLFGTEEMIDSDGDHHHYGSRAFASGMSARERGAFAGMMSIDMVGVGDSLHVRTMRKGPQDLSTGFQAFGKTKGWKIDFLADTGRYGFSDHEPFELAGLPAVWVEWRDDSAYHTARDTAGRVDPGKMKAVGDLVDGFVSGMSETDLKALHDAAR
jgi:hypothetical protein